MDRRCCGDQPARRGHGVPADVDGQHFRHVALTQNGVNWCILRVWADEHLGDRLLEMTTIGGTVLIDAAIHARLPLHTGPRSTRG